jgi:hypothetical protein
MHTENWIQNPEGKSNYEDLDARGIINKIDLCLIGWGGMDWIHQV